MREDHGRRGSAIKRAFERFSVSIEDLELMDSAGFAVSNTPDDFFITRDFEEFDCIALGSVAGDDQIAVWKPLSTAGVFQWGVRKVFVGEVPDDLSFEVHLGHGVSVSEIDDGVAVWKPDRGERPRVLRVLGCLKLPHDFSFGGVFSDDLVEELGHKIVAVRKFSGHPAFHMMVSGLTLEHHLDHNFTGAVHFQQTRFISGFGEQNVSILERLGGVHLGLGAFKFKDDLVFAGDLDDCAAWIIFVF